MDLELNRKSLVGLVEERIKGCKKKRKKLKEKRLDNDSDDGVPDAKPIVSAHSTTVIASQSLSKKKGLRERFKSARRRSTRRHRRQSRDGSSIAQFEDSGLHLGEDSFIEELNLSPSETRSQQQHLSVVQGEHGEGISLLPATNAAHPSPQSPPAITQHRPLRSLSIRSTSTVYSPTAQTNASPISAPEPIYSPYVSFPTQPPAYRRVTLPNIPQRRGTVSSLQTFEAASRVRPDDVDSDQELREDEDDGHSPSHDDGGNSLRNYTEGHVATDDKRILENVRKFVRSEPLLSGSESGVDAPAAPSLEEIEDGEMEILRGERVCSTLESLSSSSRDGGIKIKDAYEGMTNRVEVSGNEELPPWSASAASSSIDETGSSLILHTPLAPPPPPPLAFPIAPPAPSHSTYPFSSTSHGSPEEVEDTALQLALGLVDAQDLQLVDGRELPVYGQSVAPPTVDDAPSAPPSVEEEEEEDTIPSAPPENEFGLESNPMLMPSAPPAPEDEDGEEYMHTGPM